MPNITPCLWFDKQALEAAEYYCEIFPNSQVKEVVRYTDAGPGDAGSVLTVDFLLDGQPYLGLNGGPHDEYNDSISLMIICSDQDEVDYYWNQLSANGGEERDCGWLKDKYGVSWQVTPDELRGLVGDPDRERANRAISAMMEMKKIDIGKIRAAAEGKKTGGIAAAMKRLTSKKAPEPVTAAASRPVAAAKKTVAKKTAVAKKTVAKKKAVVKKTVAKKKAVAKKTVAKKKAVAKKTAAKRR